MLRTTEPGDFSWCHLSPSSHYLLGCGTHWTTSRMGDRGQGMCARLSPSAWSSKKIFMPFYNSPKKKKLSPISFVKSDSFFLRNSLDLYLNSSSRARMMSASIVFFHDCPVLDERASTAYISVCVLVSSTDMSRLDLLGALRLTRDCRKTKKSGEGQREGRMKGARWQIHCFSCLFSETFFFLSPFLLSNCCHVFNIRCNLFQTLCWG